MRKRYIQVYVTGKEKRNHFLSRIISTVILIFIFFIMVVLFLVVLQNKKKDNLFLQKEFYFVYAYKFRKESVLYDKKEEVKKLGGANEIYLHRNEHYLIVNVYLKRNEAESVLKEVKMQFSSAGILRLYSSKFSKNAKQEVFDNFEIKNSLKRIDTLDLQAMNLQVDFLSLKKVKSDIVSEMSKNRVELLSIAEKLSNNKCAAAEIISNHVNLELMYYSEFFEKYYAQTKNRAHLIGSLAVKLALNQIKMINNLSAIGKY